LKKIFRRESDTIQLYTVGKKVWFYRKNSKWPETAPGEGAHPSSFAATTFNHQAEFPPCSKPGLGLKSKISAFIYYYDGMALSCPICI